MDIRNKTSFLCWCLLTIATIIFTGINVLLCGHHKCTATPFKHIVDLPVHGPKRQAFWGILVRVSLFDKLYHV